MYKNTNFRFKNVQEKCYTYTWLDLLSETQTVREKTKLLTISPLNDCNKSTYF